MLQWWARYHHPSTRSQRVWKLQLEESKANCAWCSGLRFTWDKNVYVKTQNCWWLQDRSVKTFYHERLSMQRSLRKPARDQDMQDWYRVKKVVYSTSWLRNGTFVQGYNCSKAHQSTSLTQLSVDILFLLQLRQLNCFIQSLRLTRLCSFASKSAPASMRSSTIEVWQPSEARMSAVQLSWCTQEDEIIRRKRW